jgi:hypothetical protein
MWIRLASFALCLAGFTAPAQSANESASGLEACFQAARFADATCSNLPNDPARRVDCFMKARAAQLECLEHVLSEAPARPAAPGSSSEMARPAPPVDTAPAEAPSERPTSKEAGRTDPPEVSVGGTPADEAARRSSPSPNSAPASVPPSVAEAPTGAVHSDTSGKRNDRPAQETDWILSETTSPVDYSPLITAVIRATSDVKDGPNSFAVRCRAQHTELSIRTDGAWAAPRSNDLPVDYQIDDRPAVRQPWILSSDGKTATYKNDPVELLRSIPEGATLKVAVADKANVRREAIFELAGLSGVRQKVGTACKWAPATAKTSSEKR